MRAAKAESTPMSAIRTLRKPWSAARSASSRQATTCSWPRAVGANTPPAGARAAAEVSQAAFGRAKRLTSTRASAASRAVWSSSSSVSMKTPLPCETRWTVTSRRAASSSTASRQRGPSVLGISIRYCAPSGKRFAESGRSFSIPGREVDRAQKVARLAHPGDPTSGAWASSNSASHRSSSPWSSSRAAVCAASSSTFPQSSASCRSSSATVSSCAAISALDAL